MAKDRERQAGRMEPWMVQAEIERARSEIARSAFVLRDRFLNTTDWRTWVRQRPIVSCCLSAALGFWLGLRRR